MLNGADTVTKVVDALTDSILMRPLSGDDRQHILDWLTSEYSVTENEVLPAGSADGVAPLIAAVMVSSAYFQLR
jgi:hypothetical protein